MPPASISFFQKNARGLFLIVGLFHIMEDVLYIFVFFDALNEFLDLGSLLFGEFFGIVRYTLKLRAGDFVAVVFEILLNGIERLEFAIDYNFFFVCIELVYAEVNQFKFQIFERNAIFGFNMKYALVIEKKREAARCTQRTAKLVEVAANVRLLLSVAVSTTMAMP